MTELFEQRFYWLAGAIALATIIAAFITAAMPSPPHVRAIAARDPFDARASVPMPAKGVRVVPVYREPAPIAPEPEPPPVAVAPPEPPHPVAVADAAPERAERHAHDGDICARHGMHRVTVGRGWRCRK
jgi:hypothetical protein